MSDPLLYLLLVCVLAGGVLIGYLACIFSARHTDLSDLHQEIHRAERRKA